VKTQSLSNRILAILSATVLLSLAACGSDSESSPPPAAGDCDALQKQCEACVDATLKQACLSSVISYKGGGDTGQKACKAAIDAKTYSGDECKEHCATLKTQCDACTDATLKTQCDEWVTDGDSAVCKSAIDTNVFASCG
jgi:hypothetical protein